MTEYGKNVRHADVVILTAIPLEYRAVLDVEAGAWPGSTWEKDEQSPNGLLVSFRCFKGLGGRPLRVAVAQAADMGAVKATQTLIPLVDAYGPSCIAMCGVCAGRPGKSNLGDVITADRLFFHDTGKLLPDSIQQDLTTYNLRDDWKLDVEHFDFASRFQNESWWSNRPVPHVWQENWLLLQLYKGVAEPWTLPECEVFCPQWKKVLEGLWKSGDLKNDELALTANGTARIKRELLVHQGKLPDFSPSGSENPFRVHVAPMGSGNKVIENEEYWSFISEHMRKTLGLEMEAAALGSLAHAWRSRHDRGLDALVMKGVMDFASHGRDDQFKEFAARASAECLIAFLREHVIAEVVPNVDDILVSGTDPLPPNPSPSMLLVPRYQVVPFHESGRAVVLAELERWCHEEPKVAVRLIHAEGGVGKTRLAIKWTQIRRDAGQD